MRPTPFHPLKLLPAVVVLALCCVSAAHAQSASAGQWHYQVTPYIMFPNMKGDIGVGTLPEVEVDESPDDIFSNLQAGAMLFLEANNGRWALSSDVLWMKLGADIPSGLLIDSGDAEVEQLGWELAALYRLSPWFEAGVGLQYNDISADIEIDLNTPGGGSLEGDLSESWIDPVVIGRATFPLAEKWYLQVRGNVGGFGVGSDLAWQVQADLGWRISQLMALTFGYRWIDVDFENGSGDDRFKYDVATFGPVLKFAFNF
jgi:hypothetical protein